MISSGVPLFAGMLHFNALLVMNGIGLSTWIFEALGFLLLHSLVEKQISEASG